MMMTDVGIFRPALDPEIRVGFSRRTRKDFRQGLVELGGEETPNGVFILPQDLLDQVTALIKKEYPAWSIGIQDERAHLEHPEDKVAWARERSVGGYYHSVHIFGYVKRVRVFEILQPIVSKGEPPRYQLICSLPPFEKRPIEVADEAEGKRRAEKVLVTALEALGAILKES